MAYINLVGRATILTDILCQGWQSIARTYIWAAPVIGVVFHNNITS